MIQVLVSGLTGERQNYLDAVHAAGGTAVGGYCPPSETLYDALLLCGGGDVDPAYYGQANCASAEIDLERDRAEFALVRAYLAAGRPIFGVCRGMQIINVALGGTLVQDIGDALRPLHRAEGRDLIHKTTIAPHSFLGRIYGTEGVVNSTHHQAIDRLGDGLAAVQWAEFDLIEAVEHNTLPVWGMQWHPERMAYANRRADTIDSAALFEGFLRLCHAK